MRKILYLFILPLLIVSCSQGAKKRSFPKEKFTIDLLLPTSPVKNQGSSSLCWVYAMLATIESEHIIQGDSVNLSADYVARMYLYEQARRRQFLPKRVARLERPITTRGMSTMTLDLIKTYGLQHYDAYHSEPDMDYNVLCRRLDRSKKVDELLDKSIGTLPKQVFMFGVRYTPYEFARSVCMPDEYTAVTSFLHHPLHESFPLEVPDNYFHDTFLNIPAKDIIPCIVNSLKKGHPVCWEGDVSEPLFSFEHGYAMLDDEARKWTEKDRQEAFEHFQTTDDHCMEIVGIAHDQHGKRFFLCKNSWGTDNPYHGFMFLSEPYVYMKTIALVGTSL